MKLYFDRIPKRISTIDVSFDGGNSFNTYNKSDLLSNSLDVPDSISSFSQIIIREGGLEDTPWYEASNKNNISSAIKNKVSKVWIPNGVTSINDWAFYLCSGLISINIPNSVTSIGNDAFEECYGLMSIAIPNSVTSIGSYAFSYCTGLTSIEVPNSVTSIGRETFSNCTSLATINYTGTQEQWNTINKGYNWNQNCPANMEINCNYQS